MMFLSTCYPITYRYNKYAVPALLMIILICTCCSRSMSEKSTGHGASSPEEIGSQLYRSFKDDDFASLAYYTPDSQTITLYYERTTAQDDADTRRNIRHYAQHITEKLALEFRKARQKADSLGIEWKRAELDSVIVQQSNNTARFVTLFVDISSRMQNGRISSKCVKINDMWFLSEDIRYKPMDLPSKK